MKTIGFIGTYNKTDLLVYIAKIFTTANKKVLIVDTTLMQRAKYIVPVISPAKSYITTFEDIDIAVGLYSYKSIKNYLGLSESAELGYDYVFFDIDSIEEAQEFEINNFSQNYFVSGFDVYSLRKGLEILLELNEPIEIQKILFSKNISYEEESYFEYLALGIKAKWKQETIYFPFEQGDQTVIIENQMVQKIKYKKLTELYRESLLYIATKILDDTKEEANIKKAFKQLEKGV